MSFLMDPSYYEVKKNGLSPFQNMCAYLGGSAIQTVLPHVPRLARRRGGPCLRSCWPVRAPHS